MASTLDSRLNCSAASPGRGYRVVLLVLLGKMLYCHIAYFHSVYKPVPVINCWM